jgi:dihydroorotase
MILIKNGRVMDPLSKFDKVADILIEGKNIKKIDKSIQPESNYKVIDATNMVVCPGLIDIHVHFREPGFTYKEDINSGSHAAARGGFTTVICMANTKPVVDNEQVLKCILEECRKTKINVLQTASITVGLKGEQLTDMKYLKDIGAIGFTDDGVALMDSSIVLKAMEIAKELDVPLSFHEEDPKLVVNPGINKGKISASLGIEGASHLAEDVLVARDCVMALETKAKVNIQHISSGLSVDIIRLAKSKGANVMAEVSPHHFSLTEDDVIKYNTNGKMNPPLRTSKDMMDIIEGLKDDTIEIIATDHAPHSKDEKNRELLKAPSGIIGLETALSLGITNLVRKKHVTLMKLIEKMTLNPAKLYNLDAGYIKVGEIADLAIFNENEEWTVNEFYSKSTNSPFIGQKLFGNVKYTICNGEVVYEDK